MFYKNEAFHNNCLAEIYEQNKLADQPKSQPTNNPEQGSSLQHKPPVQQPTQSSNDHHLNNPLTSKPISSTPVSEEATNTNNDMDIDNSNLSNNNNSNILNNSSEQQPPLHQASLPSHKQQSNQKPLQQPQSSQSYSQAARPKLNPSYDFLANFPVTDEMQSHTKLQTEISRQLFNFLKEHFHNFYPGKIIKEATGTKYALKASFYLLIRQMAGARPQFLTDLIKQHNSDNDKSATIPFNILEETLKKLILTFTTVLFTKLNYPEIFASPATIPPIQTHNCLQFCINLA